MSTPFDEERSDFLEKLGIPIFKIPSGEITNLFLLSHIGRKKKRVILSTGMSTLPEIEVAFEIDSDGIVNVSARDLATERVQNITVHAASTLSEEEILDIIADHATYDLPKAT